MNYSTITFLNNLLLICLGHTLMAVIAAQTAAHTPMFFTSIAGLQPLLETEKHLLSDVRQYIEESKKALAGLESDIKSIEEDHKLIDTSNEEKFLSNPLNAFRLIRRLYYDWSRHADNIEQNKQRQEFLSKLEHHKDTQHFPRSIDVDGAAAALVRLQKIYKLPVSEIASGFLNRVKYSNELNWHECLTVFEHMSSVEKYEDMRMWLKEFVLRISRESVAKDENVLERMQTVAETFAINGDIKSALELSKLVLQIDPTRRDTGVLENVLLFKKAPPTETIPQNPYHNSLQYKLYKQLCHSDISSSHNRLLRCFYATNNMPYRVMVPFKVEVHNLDPFIITFHDILADTTINAIKRLATPSMHLSTTEPFDINVPWPFQYKINKLTWLPYDSHKNIQRILQDLHDATGLHTTRDGVSRQLQVVNYGLGGFYEPHLDLIWPNRATPKDNKQGDRLATAMFYLSDVEQGGATVFPLLNVRVQPKRGNLLFWYNMNRDLSADNRTLNGGCPVIAGSKWIANIWIHEKAQIFSRPCTLSHHTFKKQKFRSDF